VISAKKKLGGATLTVAVLVIFFVLTLAAFLLRVLAGLATLLTRLATLLALAGLATLLTFLLHIVCHEIFLLRRRGPSHAFRNLSPSET